MNSAEKYSASENAWFIAGCCITAIYGWTVYVPLIPNNVNGDADWLWALSVAQLKGLSLGRDIMFTYGPLGYIWHGYFPTTFPILVLTWTAFATATWIALFSAMRRLRASRVWTVAGIAIFFVLAAGEHSTMSDTRTFLLAVLLLAYHFCVDNEPRSVVKSLLFGALGLAALVKFTYLVAALLVCGAIGGEEILQKRPPIGVFVCCVVYLIGWRLTGQAFSNLPAYFASSIDLTNGYAEAMCLWLKTEAYDVFSYWIPAALLIALVWMAGNKLLLRRRALHSGVLLVLVWLIFKAGYVRHDSHEILATSLLPPAVLIYALFNQRQLRQFKWTIPFALCMVLSLYTASRAYSRCVQENIFTRSYQSFGHGFDELVDVAQIMRGHPSVASKMYADCCRETTDEAPLPKVAGPTDLFMTWPFRVIANGLDYLPRPSIQGYSAYTPTVAWADANFLRSERGPTNIFFALDGIDARLPALTDGPAMLELISRFDLVGSTEINLQFRRSKSPRSYTLKPVSSETAQWNSDISIPKVNGKLIWAVVDLKPTLYGRLVSALYKPPIILINLKISASQSTRKFRFIPGCGRVGFVISPYLFDLQSSANLCMPAQNSRAYRVYPLSFRLTGTNDEPPHRNYSSTFEVQFFTVEISDEAKP